MITGPPITSRVSSTQRSSFGLEGLIQKTLMGPPTEMLPVSGGGAVPAPPPVPARHPLPRPPAPPQDPPQDAVKGEGVESRASGLGFRVSGLGLRVRV